MKQHKLYSLTVIGVFVTCLLIGLPVAYWLEPLSGDLTRMGGYSENDFGWRSTQMALPESAAETGDLDRSYDVVVLGDSFSGHKYRLAEHEAGQSWSDFFASKTGLKVGVFSLDIYTPEQVLRSEGYRRAPPRIFVYQTIERVVSPLLTRSAADCPLPAPEEAFRPNTVDDNELRLTKVKRETSENPLQPQLGYAFDYLTHFVNPISLLWPKVFALPLTRSDLFSNRRGSTLLFFRDDTAKKRWAKADWDRAGCTLEALQNVVQESGRTSFVALIPPDKLTAYAPYLVSSRWKGLSHLSEMLDSHAVNAVRIDKIVAEMIANGDRDVYLPDDVHWGSIMQLRAAEELYKYLAAHSVIHPTETRQPESRLSVQVLPQ